MINKKEKSSKAMKRVVVSISMAMFTLGVFAQWQTAGDKIKTVWAEKIDPAGVFQIVAGNL